LQELLEALALGPWHDAPVFTSVLRRRAFEVVRANGSYHCGCVRQQDFFSGPECPDVESMRGDRKGKSNLRS
jgi:hypothetical protein